jgi:peptidoglycan/LPS O-acetylase OafA/YrhL
MNTMAGGNEPVRQVGGKQLLRVGLGTAGILLIPFVAMQFTREVNWTAGDFLVAAVLLAGTGMLFELARAKLRSRQSRLIAGAVIGLCFLFVWAELAVGIVGSPIAGS